MTSPPATFPPPGAPLLALRGVACQRGGRRLFDGLDLVLRAGEATWLRGGNGRGKTSLLRVAAGLSAPEAGVVERADDRAPLYLGHATALSADLEALEALAFLDRLHAVGSHASSMPAAASASDLVAALAAFGLAGRVLRQPVRRLSEGQRRRVALARLALPGAPSTWLLDEPFEALDAEGVAAVEGRLARHRADGGTVLLASHLAPSGAAGPMAVCDLDELVARSDRSPS